VYVHGDVVIRFASDHVSPDQTVECEGEECAVVNYTITTSDVCCETTPTVVSVPPPGRASRWSDGSCGDSDGLQRLVLPVHVYGDSGGYEARCSMSSI